MIIRKIDIIHLLTLFTLLIWISSCANIKPITGGDDDHIPPKIILEKSTPNYQKNFTSRKIILHFDEWVKLDNPTANIIVSPTTEYPLNYTLKGKTLIVKLNEKEILKENTTYSIQFGDAIQDITANNKASTIKYVFSTGDYIDSLMIRGIVKDAKTLLPAPKVLVLLYNNLMDTAVKRQKPDYFTWTDSSGRFQFQNIKSNTYSIYTLIDKNQNYYFDQPNESFGFLNQSIVLTTANLDSITLKISQENLPLAIKEKRNTPGKMVVILNQAVSSAGLNPSSTISKFQNFDHDSLTIWYQADSSFSDHISYENQSDTIKFIAGNYFKNNNKEHLTLQKSVLTPEQHIELNWVDLIKDWDTTKIHFIPYQPFKIICDTLNTRKLFIVPIVKNQEPLTLVIDSMMIKGISNKTNVQDTFRVSLIQQKSLSNIKITFDSVLINHHYIFEIKENDKILIHRTFVAKTKQEKISISNILPGKYKAVLILDENENDRWDPIKFDQKRMPEQVYIWELSELRADWEVEVTLKLQ